MEKVTALSFSRILFWKSQLTQGNTVETSCECVPIIPLIIFLMMSSSFLVEGIMSGATRQKVILEIHWEIVIGTSFQNRRAILTLVTFLVSYNLFHEYFILQPNKYIALVKDISGYFSRVKSQFSFYGTDNVSQSLKRILSDSLRLLSFHPKKFSSQFPFTKLPHDDVFYMYEVIILLWLLFLCELCPFPLKKWTQKS